MLNRWPARLGLVSMGVLALAACSPASDRTASTGTASDAAATTGTQIADVEPLGPSEAAAAVGPAASRAAAEVSPEIAAARAFDTSVTNAAANTVEAYRFDQGGDQIRAWNDPRLGSRIVTPGTDGYVISYYRPGATQPYLLREGERFYVVSGGRIVHVLDVRGRVTDFSDAERDRWAPILKRSTEAHRAASRRRGAYLEAKRADSQADRAAAGAQQAKRDASKAEGRADRAEDKAQDAAQEARDAATQGDREVTRDARRDAKTAAGRAGRADRAADHAEEASDRARDAGRDARDARREAQAAAAELKARCDRAKARGEKDAACAKVR